MEDARVTKCLTAKRESKAVEFKEQFDPTDNRQALEVLKDIVAICNAGGGTLAIGIDNAGKGCGSDVQPVLDYDHAKYCDLIKKYTMQNFADFEVIEAKKDGHAVAIFLINPPDSPLIFEKPGTYAIDSSHQKTVFSQGTIYFRHGAKSETGTTEDLSKFLQQRVREMRNELVKGMRRVTEAPRGSQIQVVSRGTVVKGAQEAVPVRMSSDPKAQGVIVVDRDQIFPYRQKEFIERLKEALPDGPILNGYDLQAISKVYNIAAQENLSWKPQFSGRQYSEALVEWIVDKISKEKDFPQATRRRLYEMNQKNK